MKLSAQGRGARTKVIAAGVAIPHTTTDLRELIKRETWTRGLTMVDLAARLKLTPGYVLKRICQGKTSMAVHPALVTRIIDALHITPAVARRLHLYGAREAGWVIEED